MNKKQLYESIMVSVAKEVKKALLENDNEYSSYDEARLDAIHFNLLPNNLKGIIDGEEWVLSENMSRDQLIKFIANINWDLLYNQYKHFFPKSHSFDEDYIYDSELSKDGGTLFVQVPCSDITLDIYFDLDYDYIPYNPGDYWQPPEGGYAELNRCALVGIDIVVNNKRFSLTKDEINFYKLQNLFVNEMEAIAEDNVDNEWFSQDDDDAYDRWKDEQW